MALDIFIQPKIAMPRVGDDYQPVTQLEEDEGYFYFLLPLFDELREKTGQEIDLYGGAVFSGASLNDLKNTIVAARQLVELQPETWEVLTGVQTSPEQRETCATVHKQKFREVLMKIEAAIEKARDQGLYIAFWGD